MRIWLLTMVMLSSWMGSYVLYDSPAVVETGQSDFPTIGAAQIKATGLKGPIRTLIIDPGHGGKDPGSVGDHKYEKDISLQVSLILRDILREKMPDLKVVMTRETDEFVNLYRRGEIAQENNGDFFLSIHCNGLGDRSSHGAETYVLGVNQGQENYDRIIKENQAILFEDQYAHYYGAFDPSSPEADILFSLTNDALRSESTIMAEMVQEQYATNKDRLDRGVKQAPFIVLYMCGMPAILTEIGFITNPQEEKYLMSEPGQQDIASGLYRAIADYNLEYQ
jgi:N-acetylmuramoyl-L-alanine amidase